MKKRVSFPIIAMMLGLMLLSGCAAGIAPADFAKVQSDLAATKSDLAKVTADLAAVQNQIKLQGDLAATKSDLAKTTADLAAAQNQIKGLEAQVGSLATISAYYLWYDGYLQVPVYVFADVAAYNAKLGALIKATRHSASIAAWDAYLAADTALSNVLAALPKDYLTWTGEQTSRWTEANTARSNALGKVGTALYSAIVK